MALDIESKIPKYLQIRKWLLSMINRGKIAVGDRIPTEEDLAQKFGVNRMTVRQALDELVLEHMIVRKRGEGSTLISAQPKSYIYELENITSFNDDMENHGIKPIHEVVSREIVTPVPHICEILELDAGEQAVLIVSVKRVAGEAVLIEKSYLSAREFGTLADMEISGPFYQMLVREFGITLHHSTQIFSAVIPGEEELRIFQMEGPEPCMMLESTVYDPTDIPIEVLFSYYRGDRYRFKASSGEYLFNRADGRGS